MINNAYITVLGFQQQPYAVVVWLKDEKGVSKTICYDEDEVQNALARQHQGFFKQLKPMIHYVDVVTAELSEKVS